MMRVRSFGLIWLLVGILPALCFGQAKVGTSGAQFLEIGISARAVGMAEAFIAVADDASAVYYNPGALTQLDERDVVLTHIDYPADINYEFAGIAYPTNQFGGGVVGAFFCMLDAGDMVLRTPLLSGQTPDASTGKTFTANSYALGVSYARNLTDRFSIGLNLKYIAELYEEESASGWGMDLGTLYRTGFRGFKIAMVLSNFGPDLKFIREEYPLPMNFKFGACVDLLTREEHKAVFNLEGSHPSDNMERYNAGLEYWYKGRFALRVGQQFEYDTGGFSAGGGVKFELSNYTIKLDYGYHDFGYLSDVHRFSLGLNF